MSGLIIVLLVVALLVYINVKASGKQTARQCGNKSSSVAGMQNAVPKKDINRLGQDRRSKNKTALVGINSDDFASDDFASEEVRSQDAAQPDNVSF
jgi:hypothetical protein